MIKIGNSICIGGLENETHTFKSALILKIDNKPRYSIIYHFSDWEVELSQELPHIVARSKNQYSKTEIFNRAYGSCQESLDIFAVEGRGFHKLIEPFSEYFYLLLENNKYTFNILDKQKISLFLSGNAKVINRNGKEIVTPNPSQSNWKETYSFYRYSTLSTDIFEAYRYLYLAIESILQNQISKNDSGKHKEKEGAYLKRAFKALDLKYSLTSEILWAKPKIAKTFYKRHYLDIRCKIFHAKKDMLHLKNRQDVTLLLDRYGELQEIWKILQRKCYGLNISPRSGWTDIGFQRSIIGLNIRKGFISESITPENAEKLSAEELDEHIYSFENDNTINDSQSGKVVFISKTYVSPKESFTFNSYGLKDDSVVMVISDTTAPIHISGIHEICLEITILKSNIGDDKKYM